MKQDSSRTRSIHIGFRDMSSRFATICGLEPDLTAASFAGQETITLTVHRPTSELVLNAIELDITSAKIEGDSGPARQATIALDATLQRCHLTFARPLSPGTWRLTMNSAGGSTTSSAGFIVAPTKTSVGLLTPWLRHSSKPPMPAGPFPAGMNRTSKPSLRPRWSSIQR